MFGEGAEHAVKTYMAMREGKEPELQALLHLFGSTPRIPYSFAVKSNEVIAYDEKGKEIVRVPIVEPLQERPHKDESLRLLNKTYLKGGLT